MIRNPNCLESRQPTLYTFMTLLVVTLPKLKRFFQLAKNVQRFPITPHSETPNYSSGDEHACIPLNFCLWILANVAYSCKCSKHWKTRGYSHWVALMWCYSVTEWTDLTLTAVYPQRKYSCCQWTGLLHIHLIWAESLKFYKAYRMRIWRLGLFPKVSARNEWYAFV